jgi:predicted secreted protein
MSFIRSEDAQLMVGEASPLALGTLTARELILTRTVDERTSAGGDGWREAAALTAPVRADLKAEGLLVSDAASRMVRAAMISGQAARFALSVDGEGTWEGAFLVRQWSLEAANGGEVIFRLRLTSTGPVNFEEETPA